MGQEVAGGMDQGVGALVVYDPSIIFENIQFVNQIVNLEDLWWGIIVPLGLKPWANLQGGCKLTALLPRRD
jgi:hypothetical protein